MHKLQAGRELAFTVLPKPPVLLKPRKAALDHPALGHDLEGVQLIAFGYLYGHIFTQNVAHALRKRLPRVATVTQHAFDALEMTLAALQGLQTPLAISHLGCGDGNGMG